MHRYFVHTWITSCPALRKRSSFFGSSAARWKRFQESSLISWSNGGYENDFKEGQNNMNEEWFGICAKGPTRPDGHYTLYPMAAYYVLKEVHRLNVFQSGMNLKKLQQHFSGIDPLQFVNDEGKSKLDQIRN